MQQTKSYWRLTALAAVAGVVTAFVGSACTVTTSTDGGFAGDSFAGSTAVAGAPSTAGAAPTAGAAGTTVTAGTGGVADTYVCDVSADAPSGTPYPSCTADDPKDPCAVCIQGSCCAEYEACYATNPGDQCGSGGPNNMGEISCVQACIQKGVHDNGVFDDTLVGTCANECLTEKASDGTKCEQSIGYRTNDLITCMTSHCQTECYGDGS